MGHGLGLWGALVGVIAGGAVVIALTLGVIIGPVVGVLAEDAATAGGGAGGSGLPPVCATSSPGRSTAAQRRPSAKPATPTSSAPNRTVTASPTGQSTPTTCVDPSANRLVAWAIAIGKHLARCPPPEGMDVCYDAGIPHAAIAWWEQTCPGCRQWQNGDLQCVMLVSAVFGLAGLSLLWGPVPNAIGFWYNFAHAGPHWVELPSAWASSPAQRGLPAPGDMLVWSERFAPGIGHIAVVIAVTPPHAGQAGAVTFAEANGPGAFVTAPLTSDRTVQTWPGGAVVGFIRYVG